MQNMQSFLFLQLAVISYSRHLFTRDPPSTGLVLLPFSLDRSVSESSRLLNENASPVSNNISEGQTLTRGDLPGSSLHVLPVLARVSSGYSGFPHNPINMWLGLKNLLCLCLKHIIINKIDESFLAVGCVAMPYIPRSAPSATLALSGSAFA
ncbi:hypothetical protein DNTS_004031 [Danionella cerebrum]|uniref:Uncharacterized protein n=1 Tax=Danionella cerebrum TaxID=2873325 RepID=A0A553QRF5_9TELE|nr:hypothetical protein DNTS_004031 [Danionella translucida]